MYSEVLDRYWQCNWPLLFPVPCMLNFVFVNYINTKYSSVFTGTILTRPRGLLNHIHIFLLYVFKKYLPERLWHSIACYAWVTCDFLFVVLCFFNLWLLFVLSVSLTPVLGNFLKTGCVANQLMTVFMACVTVVEFSGFSF